MAFSGWNSYSRKNKYGARESYAGGEKNDSTNEGSRYLLLSYMQSQREISMLRRQVSFEIIPRLTKIVDEQLKTKIKKKTVVVEQDARYTCDFVYKENGIYVMEEFKSEMTAKLQDYVLRKKLMLWKIKKHNEKGKSKWIFREIIYSKGGTTHKDYDL